LIMESYERSFASSEAAEQKIASLEKLREELRTKVQKLAEEHKDKELSEVKDKLEEVEKSLASWVLIANEFHKAREMILNGCQSAPVLLHELKWRDPQNPPKDPLDFEDPTDFLLRFVCICLADGLPWFRFFSVLPLCLNYVDTMWFKDYMKDKEPNKETWKAFEVDFYKHFIHPCAREIWYRKIQNLKMSPTCCVRAYSDEFLGLAYKLNWKTDDEMLIHIFLKGLTPWIRKEVRKVISINAIVLNYKDVQPSTVELLTTIARSFESSSMLARYEDEGEKGHKSSNHGGKREGKD